MKRSEILRIGISYTGGKPGPMRIFARAFRLCFSGMSFGRLRALLCDHIKDPAVLHAALEGARDALLRT